jgi:ribonucleoside-triphosphate reductase
MTMSEASVPPIAFQVRKRDGQTLQEFDFSKVQTAIRKAWLEAHSGKVDEVLVKKAAALVRDVFTGDAVTVEQIQDCVEATLMRFGQFEVAKKFILYRHRRTELRQSRRKADPNAVSDYIHFSKYARYLPKELRRESYLETVDRVEAMHQLRFADVPGLDMEIRWAFDQVREKRVLPSMRSMQFAGPAAENIHNRIYNCTFTHVDRPRVFAEALFLLLCGSGVGYSVQYEHVNKLPRLGRIDMENVVHHTVEDTIEGWGNALDALINGAINGENVEFNYSLIRKKGTPLKTSGGKAPGHRKLKESLERIRGILLGAQGRQLRPIECHDILCHAADAVLSGGIRRSAMISLFSLEDSEMVYAKTGNWNDHSPWRANANNSVMLKRDEVKKKQFLRIYKMTREWGEPGFYFCFDYEHGANPCVEIGLFPRLVIDDEVMNMLTQRAASRGKPMPDVKIGDVVSGWAFCNLCEINAAKLKTLEDFMNAGRAAAIIGTLQASYTDMEYLGWPSEVIAEREALLGVGMTGMLDSPGISCNPEYQRAVAEIIKETNKRIAAQIGIRTAARTTCVKPSGTTSLELGCVASGHHAHHARRYIRRVTADGLETVFQAFKALNPGMCVQKPDGKWVVEFPVEAPDGAIVKDSLSALSFLEMVKSTQENWVIPGTQRPESTPGLRHNVSNTVHVKPDEWDTVGEYIWKNREMFTGIALMSATGDKDFAFAPNEAITTEADEVRWNQLIANYKPVDYSMVVELEDGTALTGEAACANGACAI